MATIYPSILRFMTVQPFSAFLKKYLFVFIFIISSLLMYNRKFRLNSIVMCISTQSPIIPPFVHLAKDCCQLYFPDLVTIINCVEFSCCFYFFHKLDLTVLSRAEVIFYSGPPDSQPYIVFWIFDPIFFYHSGVTVISNLLCAGNSVGSKETQGK